MTCISSQKNWFTVIRSTKKCLPSLLKWIKLVPSYFEPEKHCRSYLECDKNGFLLFGEQKIQFITVSSKEKDYDIYLKSEKLVHRNQEQKKMFPSYFEVEKTGCQLFLASQTLLQLFAEKKVDPCYWETKKCSSKLLGAKKMIITCISSQKNWFTAIRSTKKMFPSSFQVEKTGSQLFRS